MCKGRNPRFIYAHIHPLSSHPGVTWAFPFTINSLSRRQTNFHPHPPFPMTSFPELIAFDYVTNIDLPKVQLEMTRSQPNACVNKYNTEKLHHPVCKQACTV